MTPSPEFDYVLVGGGLQGCLLAHALAHHQPDAKVLLVERADALCGNHTWSFHESDVPPASRPWLDSWVGHRWQGYRVKFPGFVKRIGIPYATITSDTLREATLALAKVTNGRSSRTPLTVRCGVACRIDSSTRVTLDGDGPIDCGAVIDCRGRAAAAAARPPAGYQSFLGHEVRTTRRWPASEPTVMDARDDQADGFEFLYELPLGPNRVLLEYTRFHHDPSLDVARAETLIEARLQEANVGTAERVRSESGCLPMPYGSPSAANASVLAGGYAGGWQHAATGYSMPLAIRFADLVATSEPSRAASKVAAVAAEDAWRRGFSRFLNRLLFCLVKPQHRWKIFRRFYRVLPEERIARFYAHRFSVTDAARIVIGRPPTGLAPLRFFKSLFQTVVKTPTRAAASRRR